MWRFPNKKPQEQSSESKSFLRSLNISFHRFLISLVHNTLSNGSIPIIIDNYSCYKRENILNSGRNSIENFGKISNRKFDITNIIFSE